MIRTCRAEDTQTIYRIVNEAATWATDFYERHGYEFLADKDELLNTYWDISPRQTETSVVLGKRKMRR